MSNRDDPTVKANMNDRDVEETMARFRVGLQRMAGDPAEAARIRALADKTDLGLAEPAPGAADHDATAASDMAGGASELTVREVSALAIRAHDGQKLSTGAPWSDHLGVVAEAMTPYGPILEMAGWLHDILEQAQYTRWTASDLRAIGVPARVVEIVELVTHVDGREDLLDRTRLITRDPEATLVKIADNADSIRPDRGVLTPARQQRLATWEEVRKILWPAATDKDVTAIVSQINPRLLERRPD